MCKHESSISSMPWQRERYPGNWDEIAKERKEQAGWSCDHCGAKQGETKWGSTSKRFYTVLLAAAHLDHDTSNPDARLAVLCQPCHLKYDGKQHWRTRRKNEREKQERAGQLSLFVQ